MPDCPTANNITVFGKKMKAPYYLKEAAAVEIKITDTDGNRFTKQKPRLKKGSRDASYLPRNLSSLVITPFLLSGILYLAFIF